MKNRKFSPTLRDCHIERKSVSLVLVFAMSMMVCVPSCADSKSNSYQKNKMILERRTGAETIKLPADMSETELFELKNKGLKYGKSSFAAKKMIVSQFIKSVRVGRNYNIEVDFNVPFNELQSFCGMKFHKNVKVEDTAFVGTA